MVKLVYSPEIINDFIHFLYIDSHSLTKKCPTIPAEILRCKNEIIQIDYFERGNLCYLEFDKDFNDWVLYHHNEYNNKFIKNSKIYLDCDLFQNKNLSYLGNMIIDNDITFNPFQQFNSKNNKTTTFMENRTYKKLIPSKQVYMHQNEIVNVDPDTNDFTNRILVNINGGIVFLNSDNILDFIIATIGMDKYYNTKNFVKSIAKDMPDIFGNIVGNFNIDFEIMKNMKPNNEYGIIHKYYQEYDKKYYDLKIETFQSDVNLFINPTDRETTPDNIIPKFIADLRRDICKELYNVYHHFVKFPNERKIMYQKYQDHSYIKLLKKLHREYSLKGKYIHPGLVDQFLFPKKQSMYNENILLLIGALKTRSQLFEEGYKLFLETTKQNIKPKYNSYHTYFPFNVFSPPLFIAEHLFQINN